MASAKDICEEGQVKWLEQKVKKRAQASGNKD